MRSIKLHHPIDDDIYFLFNEDGTYTMHGIGGRDLRGKRSWTVQERDGQIVLLFKGPNNPEEWRPFWDEEKYKYVQEWAIKLTDWQLCTVVIEGEYATDACS